VANLDSAYAYYADITGQSPEGKLYNGKLTIAQVPGTCGAGCGYLGASGIEILDYFMDWIHGLHTIDNNRDHHIYYYELGRNFWFFSPQLTYSSYGSAVTGFAIHSQFGAMQRAGVTRPFDINSVSWTVYESELRQQFSAYLSDTTKSFSNTLQIGSWTSPTPTRFGGFNHQDLFASMLFRLQDAYGGDAFIRAFWRAVRIRPAATSIQDAVDNLVLSASQAANRNLTSVFSSWRFPVSAAARTEASSRWGT
jgi:hypothetical protein